MEVVFTSGEKDDIARVPVDTAAVVRHALLGVMRSVGLLGPVRRRLRRRGRGHHREPWQGDIPMKLLDKYARAAGMSDEAWRRHANPWSEWTRFAAIPLMMPAIWSRVWIGWWALAPVGVVVLWLWWNPHAFAPVDEPVAWTSRGIYGERLWLQDRSSMPAGFAVVQRIWIVGAVVGAALLTWGLAALLIWPAVFGAVLVGYGQLWRIDRLGIFYDEVTAGR